MSQNFSQMFQGLSSGSGSGNTNFLADYASLKSGSYGRLMKAYYGSGSSSSSVSSGSKAQTNNVLERILEERRNPKVSEDVKEANANLTAGIPTLKNTVSQYLYRYTEWAECNREGGFCDEEFCVSV